MSRLVPLVASLALLAACRKPVDPAYLAAVEARAKAVCECQPASPTVMDCVSQAEQDHPLTPPGGGSAENYEDGLDAESHAKVVAVTRSMSNCQSIIDQVRRMKHQ